MTPDDSIETKPAADAKPEGAKVAAREEIAPPDSSSAASDADAPPQAASPVKKSPAPASAAADAKPAAAVAKPAAKPAPPPKPPAPPPAPFVPRPSLPVSMINSPGDAKGPTNTDARRFPGELDEDFEAALKRVEFAPRRRSLAAMFADVIVRLIRGRPRGGADYTNVSRVVAFDGFRTNLHDEKLERDRRYGTVYAVMEEANAYLVRLEMPRRMPNSALKRTWNLPDEMPDYDYSISLRDGVLSIRAGVPGEAWRRLSYVSASFPSDFLTRIEFTKPVGGFRHRLRDKVLEIIVFKLGTEDGLRGAA